MYGHSRQKRGKTRSVTEAMPTEMYNMPVNEEFTAFVRNTLTCLNDKMDNLIADQANHKKSLATYRKEEAGNCDRRAGRDI